MLAQGCSLCDALHTCWACSSRAWTLDLVAGCTCAVRLQVGSMWLFRSRRKSIQHSLVAASCKCPRASGLCGVPGVLTAGWVH